MEAVHVKVMQLTASYLKILVYCVRYFCLGGLYVYIFLVYIVMRLYKVKFPV